MNVYAKANTRQRRYTSYGKKLMFPEPKSTKQLVCYFTAFDKTIQAARPGGIFLRIKNLVTFYLVIYYLFINYFIIYYYLVISI